MSKHKKIRFIIHYVKPTAQLLFKFDFQKVDQHAVEAFTIEVEAFSEMTQVNVRVPSYFRAYYDVWAACGWIYVIPFYVRVVNIMAAGSFSLSSAMLIFLGTTFLYDHTYIHIYSYIPRAAYAHTWDDVPVLV